MASASMTMAAAPAARTTRRVQPPSAVSAAARVFPGRTDVCSTVAVGSGIGKRGFCYPTRVGTRRRALPAIATARVEDPRGARALRMSERRGRRAMPPAPLTRWRGVHPFGVRRRAASGYRSKISRTPRATLSRLFRDSWTAPGLRTRDLGRRTMRGCDRSPGRRTKGSFFDVLARRSAGAVPSSRGPARAPIVGVSHC